MDGTMTWRQQIIDESRNTTKLRFGVFVLERED
jgi:hypothetical protein